MKFLLVEEDKKEMDYLGEHPTPNNESNSNCDIDILKKEFESMSSNDIINLLGIPNINDIDTSSPMFILPNGAIISVAQAGRLIGEELKSSIHSDMIYVILKALANKHNYNCDIDGTYKYEKQKLNYLTNGLDWARLNCGETWTEKRFYCVLPNYMTSSQYRSLEKWLEWGADTGKKEVLVYVGSDEVNQTYYFNETFPEDIIKKIKRYYSSGRLYEGFLHSFDKLININVTEAEQIATKYVSTTPTYQSWIDNKGRFIDASKLGSHYNLIDEVFWQLSDRGQLQDINPLDLDPDDYNKMTDLIGDSFTTTGWIQIGLDCKWAGIFQKPTTVQYRAIEEYLDYAQHKGIGNFSINVGTGDDFAYADYDLKEVTPEYVVSRIKRYFASGKLYENRKELKENMNDNGMNIHPQVAKELEYYRRTAESPYNKGSRREYENIDNYKEYQKEIDRNGDKNLLVYGRFSNPNEYRRYTVDEIKKNNKIVYAVPFARRYKDSDLLVHRPDSGGEILVNIEDIVVVKNVNEMKENMNISNDVEMFYDRHLRLWTIYLKDEEGNQISNTEYAPNRKEALYIANNKGLFTMRESLNTPNDITNEVQRAVDNIIKNKSKYRNQDDLESAIYSAVANCFSGMNGVTRTTSDMIDDVYEKELERVGLNTINEEFVNELVPGELYHFIHNNKILYGTFKRKTPAWLFFDVEGEEVLAKPWTSVATTTEELEELIGLVNKMEKDTKVPSQVPNRFTRVPNQHNKPLGEDYVEDLVVGKKYYFTNRGEVYHAKFKEKTPTWLVFVDDNGETIYTNHWVDISTSKKDLLDTPNNPYEKDSEDKKSKKDFEIDDKEVAEISDDDKKKEFKDKANAILSKVISGVKSCGGSIRNIDRNFDEDSFRLTIVCSVSEAKEDRFEDTIELSIKSNLRELISAKDLTISVFNKMASKDNNINYYISVEGKDWRSKLTEGLYGYQTYQRTGERNKPIYTLTYGNKNGFIAKYDKNSYMITFGSDWEHHITHLIEWLKEYYPGFFVKNVEGEFIRFSPTEDEAINYIKNEIRRGKALTESNELKQRAKKHSKKQKGMSPFISLNAGNVEKGIEVFNSSVADGSGMAMCEDMDKQTYHYEGPIYYNGHKEASKTDIYTRATSIRQAKNNIIYRISGGKDMYKFDIVDNQIEEVIDDNYEEIPHDPHNKCDRCGNLLNNNNECPRCDYGEYDLDESIQVDSNLDAMAQLNRLD